ncbi:macrolide family glycosyltransferase [Heyndrickxia ginsengihumi]|uniref:macrolide family glycosyltransferase n=1 Tax=Heyndrickxia ginsengihumi TaxID=363870 RepID=UPI00203D83D5|nr:macrolide family glycosyltransferase [Heyndrickxia ginsengihumi]MCM3022301.1 glycosyl transferase [Heyndrickxia ginsengihumi]
MSRVLYLGLPGEGHVNPSLGLIQELVKRGEEVIYYGENEHKERIIKSGAIFRPFSSVKPKQDEKGIKSRSNPLKREIRILQYTIKRLPSLLNEIKEAHIDYIIFDTQFVLRKIIAQVLELPSVSFCTTFAFSKNIMKAIQSNRSKIEFEPSLIEKRRALRDYITNEYHFSFPESIMFNTGDITLVCTSMYFQPESNDFDESFKFIGPSIAKRKDKNNFPIDALKGKHVIFISMGTVVNEQPTFYAHCLEAFKDIDAMVVMSIGKKSNVEDFKQAPSNFIIRNYVPQLDVLQTADIFITHCGMNSTSEALFYNVPLVMNPVTADQPLVARRVQQLGAGVMLNKTDLNPLTLRKAAESVLSDKIYRVNALKIGASLRNTGGCLQGADEIFSFKKTYIGL